jgi:hypothetical protein
MKGKGRRSAAGWKENGVAASWLLAETNERLRGKKRNKGNSLVVSEAEGVSCALWFRL